VKRLAFEEFHENEHDRLCRIWREHKLDDIPSPVERIRAFRQLLCSEAACGNRGCKNSGCQGGNE
jgi:hypothetical protein